MALVRRRNLVFPKGDVYLPYCLRALLMALQYGQTSTLPVVTAGNASRARRSGMHKATNVR